MSSGMEQKVSDAMDASMYYEGYLSRDEEVAALEQERDELLAENAKLRESLEDIRHMSPFATNDTWTDAADRALKGTPSKSLKDLKQQHFEELGKLIHYPEHWDTMAYPAIEDALKEIGCSECEEALRKES